MNQALFALLLQALVRLLPADRQERCLRDWLADYDQDPRPFLHALTYLPAAVRMRAPFEVLPEDIVPVHPLDRLLLVQGKIIWALAAFVAVTYLLTVLVLGGWTAESTRWLTGAAMFLIYAGALIRTGFGVDWPWLRMTRSGSFLQFMVGVGALVLIVQETPSPTGNNLALLTMFTIWTWTGYWGVHRPLKKRGFLSR